MFSRVLGGINKLIKIKNIRISAFSRPLEKCSLGLFRDPRSPASEKELVLEVPTERKVPFIWVLETKFFLPAGPLGNPEEP